VRVPREVFVDTGAWIALAEVLDPYHERALAQWERLRRGGIRLSTSVAVVLETFTFLDRRGSRELALRWKDGLAAVGRLEVVECRAADLDAAWAYFDRKELHKLSLVDALSFVIMRRRGIHSAFAFDTHFAAAGFRCLG